MRNIVVITPGFPADESDFLCIPPLQALVREIKDKKLAHITVISIHYPFTRGDYQWHGVTIHACGGANRRWMRLFILNRAAKIFKQINKEQQIDGIHSFWLNDSAVTGYMMAKKFKYPHWVTLMGQDALPTNRFINFFKRIKQSRKKNYLETIVLSGFHNQQLLKTTGREADHIIPWGLDTSYLPPFQRMPRTIDLLAVGSLIRLKNYDLFLEVISILKKTRPDISCMLIGDGPERLNLEKLALKLELQHNLTFTGVLPRTEILEIMMQSKVFVHPSSYESYGFVFAEALFAGMYLVTTPVGIAEASPKWKLVNDTKQWPEIIDQVLSEGNDFTSTMLEDIRETALAYRRVWES
jgi:glycosyltransferase involved in cell wall biosynthesis